MKNSRKKVPYCKPSKRNVMEDIRTDAGRRAINRAAEKESEVRLRAALNNPTDGKGKPVAAHLVKKIAAERLTTREDFNPASDFNFACNAFMRKLTYQWGCATSVSSLWKTFLELVEEADRDIAADFAKSYAAAFRWCAAGHVHRIEVEYEQRPDAIVTVEVWRETDKCFEIGIQRDGKRRMMSNDRAPESPMMVFAGAKMHHFIAPQDLKKIQGMGYEQFLATLRSGHFKFSPPPITLVDEDALLNVARPTDEDLTEIRRYISILGFKPTCRSKPKA